MDLARRMYSRDLKIAAMREIEGGRRIGEVARRLEVSPHLLERWRGEWRARGELAFPGIGRRGVSPALTDSPIRVTVLHQQSPWPLSGSRVHVWRFWVSLRATFHPSGWVSERVSTGIQ